MVVLEDGVGDIYFTLTRLGMGILKTQWSLWNSELSLCNLSVVMMIAKEVCSLKQ